jgi:hypothetical protein
VRLGIAASAVASFVGLASLGTCGTSPTPGENVPRASPTDASSAPPAVPNPSGGVASAAPIVATSASVVPTVPASNPASFICGTATCASGKELCCALGMGGIDVGCQPASDRSSEDAMKSACHTGCPTPTVGCEAQYIHLSACDESADCASNEACCRSVEESVQHAAVFDRCVVMPPAAGKMRLFACRDADELCIVGGRPCRNLDAECIEGVCKKPPKNSTHACSTAADCLHGERCIDDGTTTSCVGQVPRHACDRNEDCQAYCTEVRGQCVMHPTALDKVEGMPAQKTCLCP